MAPQNVCFSTWQTYAIESFLYNTNLFKAIPLFLRANHGICQGTALMTRSALAPQLAKDLILKTPHTLEQDSGNREHTMLAEIMEVSRQLLVLLYESIAPGPCWQVICHQERGLSREAAAARLCCQPPLSRTLAALRLAIAGPPHAQLPLRQLSAPQRRVAHKGTGLCVCAAMLHTGHLRCSGNPQSASTQVVQPRTVTGDS